MANNLPSKIYTPNSGDIRDQLLRDTKLGFIEAGVPNPAIQAGTEMYIRATAIDNALQGLFANMSFYSDDSSENTATGDALDTIRDSIGLASIPPSPSAGKLVVSIVGSSARTFQDGLLFTMPNGKSGKVFGTQTNISNGQSVKVIAVDTGSDTNLAPGTKVQWSNPPLNVQTEATVDDNGLTGGTDVESDEKKRERIKNRRKNLPASGNAGFCIEIVEAADNAIAKGFCYPALGGPSSIKMVVIKSIDADNDDFSRVVPDAKVTLANSALLAAIPTPMEVVTQSVAEELTDVALSIQFDDSAGEGWENLTVFPFLTPGETHVQVTAVSDTQHFTLGALTTTAPVNGSTKIAWWSQDHQEFVIGTIISHSGSSGGWVVTVDTPFTSNGDDISVGDYISPSAINLATYRSTWLAQMNKLGPGENASSAAILSTDRQRGYRQPPISQTYPKALTSLQTGALQASATEILDVTYLYTSKSEPTVPMAVATAPNVLKLRNFGIYKE